MRVALFCILSATIVLVSSVGLREEFSWTRLDYAWAKRPIYKRQVQTESRYGIWNLHSSTSKPTGINSSGQTSYNFESIEYQYENNIPMGANVWRNKLFITVPRRRLGIPSTLNYVRLDSPQKHNVPLTPYPSWAKNVYSGYETPTENFFSVYRVAVDPCDRLWFVDTGLLELPGNRTKIKPMTLVIMDLNTDTVIRRYTIPKDQLKDTSVIATVTVDITEFCDKAFAYLPDFAGFGLIVYDFRRNRSWRVSHNYFHPEPGASNLTIGGLSFQFNDGVFSVELSQVKSNGFRDMYFHALAGTHMYKVSTELLRNETLATVTNIYKNDIKSIGDRGPRSQTSQADLDKTRGIMFLGLISHNALGCWNIHHSFDRISFVHKDDEKMIYPSDVKIRDDKVYALTNSMPLFVYGTLNYDVVNFRVWSNTVEGAVQGTKCENRG